MDELLKEISGKLLKYELQFWMDLYIRCESKEDKMIFWRRFYESERD